MTALSFSCKSLETGPFSAGFRVRLFWVRDVNGLSHSLTDFLAFCVLNCCGDNNVSRYVFEKQSTLFLHEKIIIIMKILFF